MARQSRPRGNARFFCEQCGAEVRAGAPSCPSCGSLFTAVRCPECGYEGRAPEFKSGCPVCGYAALGGPQAPGARGPTAPTQKKRRGMPLVFSRIAVLALSLALVGLVLVLILRG